MKFVYSDKYELDIGVHVFSTDKYRRVKERLLAEGLAKPEDFVEAPDVDPADIRLVHTDQYVDDMLNLRWTPRTVRSELPLTEDIVGGYMLHASGTIAACRLALENRVALHLGGGFHHAFADHGEGFCYVNDIAVGILKMFAEDRARRAAVVDCDLHQGNGTARIFQDDTRVFTFSIHQERLYPVKQRSNLDIGLDDETGDEVYLEKLRQALPTVLEGSRPELVVYVAGADPYHDDQLGTLRLTKRGLALRDRVVLDACFRRGIPVAAVLAGGYAHDTQDTVEIHYHTARECLRVLGELPRPVPADEAGETAVEAAAADVATEPPPPADEPEADAR